MHSKFDYEVEADLNALYIWIMDNEAVESLRGATLEKAKGIIKF